MKLSELNYSNLCALGLSRAHIPTDCSDSLRLFESQDQFEKAKQDLFDKYGDVDLIITPDAVWYDRIRIDDAQWQRDHAIYCANKAVWCAKHGCD